MSRIQKGQTHGGLLVIGLQRRDSANRGYYNCECFCGNKKVVRQDHLRSGAIQTCGCGKLVGTHGMTGTPEYIAWGNMIQRCTNPKHPDYRHYGGRGISVHKSWLKFANFFADMGKSNGLTLERKDNDGDYEPSNCEWATWQTQANNKFRS